MMNWIDLISSVLGLGCVLLAGRRSKWNFYLGYVYNIFLFSLFWREHLVAAMLLQPIAFSINVFGHWRWTHPAEHEKSREDGKSLKVSGMNFRSMMQAIAAVIFMGGVWAVILKTETQDPLPWLDSYILMLTFLAQFLSAQKKWECWIVWIVVNIANCIMYCLTGLHYMPIVSALYLINGIWSLYSWKKSFGNER